MRSMVFALLLAAIPACQKEVSDSVGTSPADDTAGFVPEDPATPVVDRDADGFPAPLSIEAYRPGFDDCADRDPTAYPGAPEVCNGLDDDCDGDIDNGAVGERCQ